MRLRKRDNVSLAWSISHPHFLYSILSFKGLLVWFRHPLPAGMTYDHDFGTKGGIMKFRWVYHKSSLLIIYHWPFSSMFSKYGGGHRAFGETCTIDKKSQRGWCLAIDWLPYQLAEKLTRPVILFLFRLTFSCFWKYDGYFWFKNSRLGKYLIFLVRIAFPY